MNIVHIVAGLPPEGGGLSELVPRLAAAQQSLGHTVTVATRAGPSEVLSPATRDAEAAGVRIVRFSPSLPGVIFFSWGMFLGLRTLVHGADVVHVHGNWTFPVWWACRCAVCGSKLLVMSPQGSFDPVRLAYSAWKKRLVYGLDQWCLRHASLIHATAECERDWLLRERGAMTDAGREKRIVVLPNGVQLPPEGPDGRPAERTERVVLYLGRNHPLKGLDLLEEAWGRVARPGWRLAVYGPGLPGRFVEGEEKWRVMRAADLFVLPTRSDNFGIAVAEALACGVPVICTKGAPWQELEGNTASDRCGWWCDVSAQGLADALDEAMGLSDEARRELGRNGRARVLARYTWPAVAAAWVERLAADMKGMP